MLKRMYVDNFRTLVNFEQRFGKFVLLVGENGTGKSTAFDILLCLKRCLVFQETLRDVFPVGDLTQWMTNPLQTFELDIVGNAGEYRYRLLVEHDRQRRLIRVKEESLHFNKEPLFIFKDGIVALYRDDFSTGPEFPMDWGRSGLAMVVKGRDNSRLCWFRQWFSRLEIVRPNPMEMLQVSERESEKLLPSLANLPDWLRHAAVDNTRLIQRLNDALREVLPGFDLISFQSHGEARILHVEFRTTGGGLSRIGFQQLSDGQRMLIGLHAIWAAIGDHAPTLCLDEPDNFVALKEIQPLLFHLHEMTETGTCQVIMISHHPRILNHMEDEIWLFRREGDPPAHTRSFPVSRDAEGLSLADLVEAGWLME
ncbi:MAG: ATP-binding protein [Magnetococcus sp. MYC-9]